MSDVEFGEGRLVDEAIDLAIRLQNDPDNPVAKEMVQSWRARSEAHDASDADVKIDGTFSSRS